MVDCTGLEIRRTVMQYRGFESLPLRQIKAPPRGAFALQRGASQLLGSRGIRKATAMPKVAAPWGENRNSANEVFHSMRFESDRLCTIRAERDRIPPSPPI